MSVIRIIHFPGTMLYGGVGSVVMNLYRNIDRTKIQFDFCVPRNERGPLDDEIESMGGKIFYIPQMRQSGFKNYMNKVCEILRNNGPYEAVHIHSVHMGAITLLAAKKAGIKKRIYHSHNTKDAALEKIPCHKIIEWILKKIILKNADERLACGKMAGEYIYGKKKNFTVINNAIQLEKFYPYNYEEKLKIRHELGITENMTVVGNIARFVKEKNQEFFVRLAKEDEKRGGNMVFLLVGDGEYVQKVKNLAKESGCEGKFIFTGNRSDCERMYNAMDVFCLPSLFEGLPVSLLEAQACGLPCILADAVTDEADLNVAPFVRLSLLDSPSKWLEKINEVVGYRNNDSEKIFEAISQKQYEIKVIAQKMCNIYLRPKENIR